MMSSEHRQGPAAKTTAKVDLEAVRALAEPLVAAHGVELVDIEWASSPGGKVLRVTIERPIPIAPDSAPIAPDSAPIAPDSVSGEDNSGQSTGGDAPGGVNVDDCARVSRDLSTALDAEDFIAPAFNLEVSSPGLNRPLRSARDYRRQLGKLAKLKLIEPAADGQRVLRGTIAAVIDEDVIEMEVDGKQHLMRLDNVREAKLVFEISAGKSPAGKWSAGRSNKRKSKGGKRNERDPRPTEKRNEQSR
jgi:ribosome maturation factor RimP